MQNLSELSDEKILYLFAVSNQHCAYLERDKCFVDKTKYKNSFDELKNLKTECLRRMAKNKESEGEILSNS